MITMRTFMIVLVTVLIGACVCGCGGSDDEGTSSNIPTNLYGTWSGSATIQRTGSTRNLSVTFNSDNSGSFTFNSRVYYRVASFSYTINGNIISCQGIIVGEDGVTNNFNQQFQYNQASITPIGSYSDIVLTKR